MATLVCFHAHPDDESIATAGTMAKAKALGHRVVLVVATRGEHGEPVPGVLEEGEPLSVRRTAETYESATVLGVDRVEFLGYVDSGMVDTPTSEEPWSFAQTPLDRAAARLAVVLGEEKADVLTTYDDNGGYGHPDHIQVHRVGRRAAELVGLEQVYEHTINPGFGKPQDVITHRVDATEFSGLKRASMLTHRSQIADDHFLLTMPADAFGEGLGVEWYIAEGPPAPEGSLAAELFEPVR
jgi:LmbE family N-acetylglucosaminyl deacetylase